MSTNKNKNALLAKLERQKAKAKAKVFTIPKIKLSAKEKKQKTEKSFIPTSKTLEKKSKSEDEMREFLASVNDIGDSDWKFEDDETFVYDDKKINDAYKAFIKDHVTNAINLDEDADRTELNAKARNAWKNLSTGDMMKWVIIAYGLYPSAEWGRKQFTQEINLNILTEEHLRKFIQDYINSDITYDKFIQPWLQNKGKEAVDFADEQIEAEGLEFVKEKMGKRLPITEEEQKRIDDLQERLDGYIEAAKNLKEKEDAREEELSRLTQRRTC